METLNKIEAALHYRTLGWSIIPVNKDKVPLLKTWRGFQKRKPTENEMCEWWNKWPDASPAVVTGEISGLVVLDIDIKHNRSSKEFDIPLTACSKTGSGGEHIFFKHPKRRVKSTNGQLFGLGVDIKADGGYVVLPPGENNNGSYEWSVGPDETELSEVPEWLMSAFEEQNKNKQKLWQKGMGGVGEGLRNQTAASMAGKIITNSAPELVDTVGWNQFTIWNQNNIPPLNENELRLVWNSIRNLHSGTNFETQEVSLDDDQYEKLIVARKDPKEVAYAVAQYLSRRYHIKTPDNKNREIFAYRDGYYRESDNFLKQEIQRILTNRLTRSLQSEIIEHTKNLTLVNEKKLEVSKDLINLKNGVYSISGSQLIEHSPKYFFTWQLPLNYVAEATCPAIMGALNTILSADDIKVIQEWFGYCLYRDYALKKSVIFVGEQNTGKTTLLTLFVSFAGAENISGVSLEQLTSTTFALAHLRDKFINIYDDLSYKDVNDNGMFKMVTGNGPITGEFKYGNQFQFRNFAKLTFSCNKIPNVKDSYDDAFFNRWIVIEFNRPIEKPDPALFSKISTDEELSGLLNFALVGLARILKSGHFSYKKTDDEIKEQMQKSGSPVAQFAYDCLEEKEGGSITKDDMVDCFRKYAKERDLPSLSKETLGKKLPKYAPYIDGGREGSRNFQVSVWQNVKIKDGAFPDLDLNNY